MSDVPQSETAAPGQPSVRPLLIFDGKCGFCKIWIDYWKRRTGDQVDYAPSQEVGEQYPQIPREAFGRSVQLVHLDGSVTSGARAVFETLGLEGVYRGVPLLAPVSELAYRVVARHRSFFYWVTRLTFGTRIEPARFAVTQWLFLRALAVIYAIAFASLAVQVKGLVGSQGVVPAAQFLANVQQGLGATRFLALPTLFWLNASDLMLQGACWLGVGFALLMLLGRMERLLLVPLYLLYLSLCLVGQQFLLFQWDSLLLEAGFLAIFFGRTRTVQTVVAWLFRLLVFRLYFLSGWVKIASQDPTWRNFTALDYHYWTQPLPNMFAWYAAKLPEWFQRGSTFGVLAVEFGTPFLIFLPRRIRMAGAWVMIGLQALIFLTGNYTFFNLLTVALLLFLFDDQALRGPVERLTRWLPRVIRGRIPAGEPLPTQRSGRVAAAVVVAVLVPLGVAQLVEQVTLTLPLPFEAALKYVSPFQIVNSYGLFATMTTTRPEIVIEGSYDGVDWHAYEFRYKPGDPARMPPFVAPYQPRLDWQMWFAALRDYRSEPWFLNLVQRLLEGSPDVLALLGHNPFPERPPQYVRALLYDYKFSSFGAFRRSGNWWQRQRISEYLPAVGLPPAQ